MPRDISGNYTLPVGNPVVSGTIIDVAWANPTMSDIATQLNNVILRDGVLPATNPIKFANGTASAPSITFNSDPAMGFYRIGTNILGVATAGTERFRVDASGEATFAGPVTFASALKIPAGTTASPGIQADGAPGNGVYVDGTTVGMVVDEALRAYVDSNATFYLNPQSPGPNWANIEPQYGLLGVNSGAVRFLGTTYDNRTVFGMSASDAIAGTSPASARADGVMINRNGGKQIDIRQSFQSTWGTSSGAGTIVQFTTDNGAAAVVAGGISVSGSTTTYATSSDVRLKTNIADAAPATDMLNEIRVRQFDWRDSTASVSHGFIAQELESVFPDAVIRGDTWMVDNSKLVPLLVKSLQEAWAVINQLRADK